MGDNTLREYDFNDSISDDFNDCDSSAPPIGTQEAGTYVILPYAKKQKTNNIKKDIAELKDDNKKINGKLDTVLEQQSTLHDLLIAVLANQNKKKKPEVDPLFSCPDFPINEPEQFITFNEYLLNDHYREQIVK